MDRTEEEERGSDSASLASGYSSYRSSMALNRRFRVRSASSQHQRLRMGATIEERMGNPQRKEKIVVAGIDFGTTYSGIAFSTKTDYENNPTTIHTNAWADGTVSEQVPTCLLLNDDRDKTLRAFGRAAREQYKTALLDRQAHRVYYFQDFKMSLHTQTNIKGNQKLKAVNGKELDAIIVFTRALEYMKQNMLTKMKAAVIGFEDNDVRWVITVPAIWKESAKKFMRLAAEKAGIPKDNIDLALEPEAASIYCRLLPITKNPQHEDGVTKFPKGTKYMILDCGGGTIDITIHEVVSDNELVELYKPTGGHWGGTQVNAKFLEHIQKLLGPKDYKKFSEEHVDDFLDFIDEFELKKRSDGESGIAIRLPTCLRDMLMASGSTANKVEIVGDKLKITKPLFRSFFDESVRSIVAHLHDLLDSLPIAIKAILMVGGYSDSQILQKAIRDKIEKPGLDVIIPTDASLCVMKGAVIYGHNPTVISQRKARYTYGVAMVVPFNSSLHEESRKFEGDNGELLCNDVFDIHVRVGDTLKAGETQSEQTYSAMSARDTSYPIVLFRSNNMEPKYVDEPGCVCEGYFLAKRDANRSGSDNIQVRLLFGLTEIKVVVIKSGGEVERAEFKLNE